MRKVCFFHLLEELRANANETSVSGIVLHHLPGHTDGLCGMQLNLPRDGTYIFTSDMFHVKENYFDVRSFSSRFLISWRV